MNRAERRKRVRAKRRARKPGPPTTDNAWKWEEYAHMIEGKLEEALTLLKKKVARWLQEKEFYTEQMDRREKVLKDHGLWPLPEKTAESNKDEPFLALPEDDSGETFRCILCRGKINAHYIQHRHLPCPHCGEETGRNARMLSIK